MGSSFFVPGNVLTEVTGHEKAGIAVDKFTWAEMKYFPIVTIAPGADFRVRLPVAESLVSGRPSNGDIPPGEYDVTFSTTLELLAGEANGNWKDFAPMRLVVTTTAKGTQR